MQHNSEPSVCDKQQTAPRVQIFIDSIQVDVTKLRSWILKMCLIMTPTVSSLSYISVFWFTAPSSLVGSYKRFGTTRVQNVLPKCLARPHGAKTGKMLHIRTSQLVPAVAVRELYSQSDNNNNNNNNNNHNSSHNHNNNNNNNNHNKNKSQQQPQQQQQPQ